MECFRIKNVYICVKFLIVLKNMCLDFSKIWNKYINVVFVKV